jgi:hypothetical protein
MARGDGLLKDPGSVLIIPNVPPSRVIPNVPPSRVIPNEVRNLQLGIRREMAANSLEIPC